MTSEDISDPVSGNEDITGDYTSMVGSKKEAIEAGNKFVGKNSRPLRDRSTGRIMGSVSEDNSKLYRIGKKTSGANAGKGFVDLGIETEDETILRGHLIWSEIADKNSGRKIKSIWFENYPELDDKPEDPYDAWSGVGVVIEGVGDFWFHVTTIGALKKRLESSKNGYIFGRYKLIVEKFDFNLIKTAIESILPEIEDYGQDIT